MSGPIKRVSRRRSFQITQQGLKRIVLGDMTGTVTSIHLAVHTEETPKPRRSTQLPTGYLLVVAHSERGALAAHAHQTIAAAALLAEPATAVVVLVLGDLTEDPARFGADKIIVVPEGGDGAFNPDLELAILTDLVQRFDPHHILLPDNAIGDGDLGRRLAAEIDAEVAAHVVELRPDGVAAHWRGGAVIARRDLPRIVLLDPETTDTALPFCGGGEQIDYQAPKGSSDAYADLGLQAIEAAQLPLEEADFIVSAGNGVADVAMLEAVASAFGAAVGASRVAVDDGKFPREKQVGATGKTVNASVYLAIGISGAVQHLQGIRACPHVIAINRDANAPITRRADLTIVADAQEVMKQLIAETGRRNWQRADDLVETV